MFQCTYLWLDRMERKYSQDQFDVLLLAGNIATPYWLQTFWKHFHASSVALCQCAINLLWFSACFFCFNFELSKVYIDMIPATLLFEFGVWNKAVNKRIDIAMTSAYNTNLMKENFNGYAFPMRKTMNTCHFYQIILWRIHIQQPNGTVGSGKHFSHT